MFPVAPQEAARLRALRDLAIVGTPPEPHFEAVCRTAAALFSVPISLVSLVEADEQWFKASCGLDFVRTSRAIAFCAHAILAEDVLVVEDATLDPRFAQNPLVTGPPHIRFYAGAPLTLGPGLQVGTLCLKDVVARRFSEAERRQLRDLAAIVVAQLRLHRAEREIAEREERYRLAALATKDAIWDWDLVSDAVTWSDAAETLFGRGSAEAALTGAQWMERIHPEDRDRARASIARVVDGTEDHYGGEYRFRRGDGSYAQVLDRGFVIRSESGTALRMVGALHDVTARRLSESALRASEERLRLALRAGRMVAWERDLRTGLATRSDNARELLGIGSGPISDLLDRVHPDDRAHVGDFSAYGGSLDAVEFRFRPPEAPEMWLCMRAEQAEPERIVGITFDITDRKRAEARLWRTANHDPLTELPNRALFQARFRTALAEAERRGTPVGLLLIDIDDFKDVNDTLGHDAGDAMLKEMGARLSALIRPADTVARLGGDEFAVVLAQPSGLAEAAGFAEHLVARLREPFRYRDRPLSSKVSIGLAGYPTHHRLPDELMKDADIALYRAKSAGRNRVAVYAPEMRALTERRVAIAGEMREALDQGRIIPFYQPKVCLATKRIVGFEALARWRHPTDGIRAPGYFGSAFEDPELARAIGACMIGHVAADMRGWLASGLDFGRVAVNVSSAEFHQPDLAETMLGVLAAAGVPATRLEIEVTETVFLGRGSDCVAAILGRFHESGVTVALDDFGTGYASLTHLKQFPVDHIKVDQSFVRGLEQDGDDAAIVAAVIGLGRSLQTQVTAEGVETQGQADRLRAMGCDFAQGYRYAKPMIGTRIPWLIRNWGRAPAPARAAAG
ncbi:sensor domain-containing phosphodiesterase [Methylobacterium planeticum]|uniref:EAL domain-containing protein n=1 Tax=Methylobacterium planeticum TaxID=2615211 RepID=A0A6N6MRI8_9HYPH|nr:EAL domain-containing protein [Methylobacterium planeticum]KAB1074345.1 EAL domain-containing protein [Methylobacterium planeticum]